MSDLLQFALLCCTSFFTMINPIGVIPVYIAMVRELEPDQARKVAIKATFFAFLILVIFALAGNAIFAFFQIRVESLRIVGGILFFFLGFNMLELRMERERKPRETVGQFVDDIAITPLAMPFICGPGAITMAILLYDQSEYFLQKVVFFSAMGLVILLTCLILLGGRWILQGIGSVGSKILMRIMGLIVMVIAVEFFFSGLGPILRDLLETTS